MPLYHVTMTQGRSDSFYVECSSSPLLKNFLSEVSTANIDNIKEVVYSKEYNVNFIKKTSESFSYDLELNIFCSSDNYSKIFKIPFAKKDISIDNILKTFKKNVFINGEKIIKIICLNKVEGLPDTFKGT